MYLFHLFRSFLPLHNPIGFGASDFIELAFTLLLVVLLLARDRIEPAARRLAEKPVWCTLLVSALPVVLRLSLLPLYPVPTPSGADDFSYRLLGDTLAHFRLANPMHPMHQFFETNFILQEPAYGSIYPLGPALALAFGQLVFGSPWVGVVLSVGLFCALCYWMLRGWTTPGWALLGGVLAACEFGPLNYWMNCYWGGAVSAAAGCLVFGALPRLRRYRRTRDAVLLGIGLGLQLLSRPYESLVLDVSVLLFFVPALRDRETWPRLAPVAVGVFLPAVVLLLLHDKAATGSWTTMPYMLSRYQYGVPTTFTFQPNAVAHAKLTADQQLYYEGQAAAHGEQTAAIGSYLARMAGRVSFYRFFLLAPLYLALPFFLLALREFRFAWVMLTLVLFGVGSSLYAYFFPHYIAAAACLFVLVAVTGLERLSAFSKEAARWILLLCGAHFLFWYGVNALGDADVLGGLGPYEAWDGINHGDPEGRLAINQQLIHTPGRQLVFVRYWPQHGYHEWIHNAADIDAAQIVWALDLGSSENERLRSYYPDRTTWLLEPDARPPRLTPYAAGQLQLETVH